MLTCWLVDLSILIILSGGHIVAEALLPGVKRPVSDTNLSMGVLDFGVVFWLEPSSISEKVLFLPLNIKLSLFF